MNNNLPIQKEKIPPKTDWYSKPIGGKAIIIFLVLIVIGLGFFHIVPSIPFAIIPKANFTYSYTFVNVDEIVRKYNNRSLGERMRGNELFDNLVDKLRDKGMIYETDERKPLDFNF